MSSKKLHHTYDHHLDRQIEDLEQEMESLLDEYDVEYPAEGQIMMTIDAMKPYVPIRKNKWKAACKGMAAITKQAYQEVFYMSALFWTANGLLMTAALIGVMIANVNPYLTMLMLTPIPTMTGLIEVLKSRNAGMAELEMSFKYSFQEIILSKMMVVGGFNLFINLVLTLSLSMFNQEILISKLLLYWLAPFTCVSALALLFVRRFRHIYAVTSAVVVWIAFSRFISEPVIIKRVESLPAELYVALVTAALLTCMYQTIHIYKRGVSFEVNH
jgi:hypothetical protein